MRCTKKKEIERKKDEGKKNERKEERKMGRTENRK